MNFLSDILQTSLPEFQPYENSVEKNETKERIDEHKALSDKNIINFKNHFSCNCWTQISHVDKRGIVPLAVQPYVLVCLG